MTPPIRLTTAAVCLLVIWGGRLSAQTPHAVRLPNDSAANAKYGPALRLMVASRGPMADTMAVRYIITNTGRISLAFCVGQAHGVTAFTATDSAPAFALVSHETCAHPIILAPGARTQGQWPVSTPSLHHDPTKFTAWMDVVDPTDCQALGCARATITSGSTPFTPVYLGHGSL